MSLFPTRVSPINKLRSALTGALHSDELSKLPERFAGIITAFDSIDVHPNYRADVFKILQSAANLGDALLDKTYPADVAMGHVMDLMAILPRMIGHLTTRPTTTGYSIMMPQTQSIYPQIFSTETEANTHLGSLQKLGAARSALVVPVKVTSDHAIQPTQPAAAPTPLVQPFQEIIPAGIIPGANPDLRHEPAPMSAEDLRDQMHRVEMLEDESFNLVHAPEPPSIMPADLAAKIPAVSPGPGVPLGQGEAAPRAENRSQILSQEPPSP